MLEGETFLVCIVFWHVQKVLLTQHYYVFWFWDSFVGDIGPKIQIPSEDKCRPFVWPPTDRQTLKFWKQSEKYKRYLQRLWAQDYVNGSVSPHDKRKKKTRKNAFFMCLSSSMKPCCICISHTHAPGQRFLFCFNKQQNSIFLKSRRHHLMSKSESVSEKSSMAAKI